MRNVALTKSGDLESTFGLAGARSGCLTPESVAVGSFPYPAEFVDAVARDAARDADRVVSYLRKIGFDATPGRLRTVPPGFLLCLAAGLRLLSWEANGLTPHREAGLPAAKTVLHDTLLSATEPGRLDRGLPFRVFALWAERFAWAAGAAFGTEVLLDDLDADDAAAEAVADLLWASRSTYPNAVEV